LTFQKSEYYQKIINLINESEFKKAKIILEDNKNKFLNDCLFFTTLAYINDQLEEYKDSESNYKKALDSLALDSTLADQIVAEANISFTMNMKMFQELETSFTRILVKLVTNWFSSLFQPTTSLG
jgi:heme oxygenase